MSVRILKGDCRAVLPTLERGSIQCCVTSPPYFGLRDYGHAKQIGLEETPDAYISALVEVFRGVRDVLADDGTLWLNIGDSYASSRLSNKNQGVSAKRGLNGVNGASGAYRETLAAGIKPKDLIGIPWMLAFALRADGWYLRQDIIWSKPNPMPESITDRCTKAHEYLFLLSKSARYFWDADAMQEPAIHAGKVVTLGKKSLSRGQAAGKNVRASGNGLADSVIVKDTRNRRSVWTIATRPYKGAHFATMVPEIAETCIKAGCPAGGTVLDPFGGAGTTGLVADRLHRNALLIELNPSYVGMARTRITAERRQRRERE